jgi:hypothetical protein
MKKIVTFIDADDEIKALTHEEFVTDGDFEEWVWHMAPSKEAAIARHCEAFEAWEKTDQPYFTHR